MNPNLAFKIRKSPLARAQSFSVRIQCACSVTVTIRRTVWNNTLEVIECPGCGRTNAWDIYNPKNQ
jgi:hypothetical protein